MLVDQIYVAQVICAKNIFNNIILCELFLKVWNIFELYI